MTPQLLINDGTDKIMAKYHLPHMGFLCAGPAKQATLTIYEPADAISDTILATFVYIEKLRKDRERAAKSGGGGG